MEKENITRTFGSDVKGEKDRELQRLKEENTRLKAKLDEYTNSEEAQGYIENNTGKTLHYLKTILGYTIKQIGNSFILRSVYAFCEEDVFEIEVVNNRLVLRSTPYLMEWRELAKTYIKQGRSYAAFFSAVTLELFNRKTFG